MAKVSELGPGSGMWRFSLPPIPRSPPPHQVQPRGPPRSSYQEKRDPSGTASPVRPLTTANWSGTKGVQKGLTDLKPPLEPPRRIERTSSTLSDRRPSVGHSSSDEDLPVVQEEDDSEEAKLRRKVMTLEAELELERSQKNRGTNKFMGGGQFKSANNKTARQCSVCFTLRDTIQKMSVERDEVLETNTYLIAEVERLKAELENHLSQLHGLGRNSQDAEGRIRRLEAERDGLSTAAAEHKAAAAASRIELDKKTLAFEQMLERREKEEHDLKEQIRKLKEVLIAREREVEQFKQSAQMFEQRTAAAQSRLEQVNVDLREMSKVRDLQARRLEAQEKRIEELLARLAQVENQPVVEDRSEYITRLEKRITELEFRLRQALTDVDAAKLEASQLRLEAESAKKDVSRVQEELASKEKILADTHRELMTSRARVADLIVANQDLQAVNKDMVVTIEQLETKKTALDNYVAELERQLAELRGAANDGDKWRTIIEEKETRIVVLEKEVTEGKNTVTVLENELHDKGLSIDNLKEDVTEAKTKASDLEKEITELKRKMRGLEELNRKFETEATNSARAYADAKKSLDATQVECASLAKVAEERAEEIKRLKKELSRKDKAILELMEKHVKDLERAKQEALEKTMQSMVRLCVVAPTVNVSFGSEALTCKAGLPGERIHDIIETQILPGFIQLFLQPKEGIGPDGTQLSKWVERLMGDMQGSIEKHLAGVFRAAK